MGAVVIINVAAKLRGVEGMLSMIEMRIMKMTRTTTVSSSENVSKTMALKEMQIIVGSLPKNACHRFLF